MPISEGPLPEKAALVLAEDARLRVVLRSVRSTDGSTSCAHNK